MPDDAAAHAACPPDAPPHVHSLTTKPPGCNCHGYEYRGDGGPWWITGIDPACPLHGDGVEPEPCACWSCNGQCGGSQHPNSCGPLAATERGPVCDACRETADVFDNDRTGISVRLSDDEASIVLDPDSFGSHGRVWLTPAGARQLAALLIERAGEAAE